MVGVLAVEADIHAADLIGTTLSHGSSPSLSKRAGSLTGRWALRLVSWYPEPWRRRYADEVIDLLQTAPVRLGDLGELARGLIVERSRALLADDAHPQRTAAILGWLPSVFALLFSAAGVAVGLALREWSGPTSSTMPAVGWGLFFVVMFVSLRGMSVARRHRSPGPHPGEVLVGAWPRLSVSYSLWLPILFVSIVCFWWGDVLGRLDPRTTKWPHMLIHFWMYTSTAGRLASGMWPQRELLGTLAILEGTEQRLVEARTWVDDCRAWIDKGVDSPIDDAVALVQKLERTRDDARARLPQLGYRARFER